MTIWESIFGYLLSNTNKHLKNLIGISIIKTLILGIELKLNFVMIRYYLPKQVKFEVSRH